MDPNKFIEQFRLISREGLPGERAHSLMLPINRPLSSDALKSASDYRDSAVAILLFEKDGSIHSTLIQRPEYEGTHSKQIAFPGGKHDDTDHNLEFTARREAFEEVNLPLDNGQLITELTTVYIPVSKFKVNPFVFYLDEEPILTPDPREVDSIIHFDVFQLITDEVVKTTDLRLSNGLIRKNIPYFDINGHVVWGATALMLSELREILKQL